VQRQPMVQGQDGVGWKSPWRWAAVGLILAMGVIHLVTAPDQFNDATYKGLLFLANSAAAVVVAVGLWKSQSWAWGLGLVLAVATAAGYVLSRTLGLPGLPVDPAVFEPLGVAAVVCEVAFAIVAAFALASRPRERSIEPQQEASLVS
jgi:hypothetical protein